MSAPKAGPTPGPWRVGSVPIVSGKYAGCYAIAPQAGPAFAVMIGGGPADIREANALLIAAAPDLLDAAKEAIEAIAGGDAHSAVNALRAALAKAVQP